MSFRMLIIFEREKARAICTFLNPKKRTKIYKNINEKERKKCEFVSRCKSVEHFLWQKRLTSTTKYTHFQIYFFLYQKNNSFSISIRHAEFSFKYFV